MEGEVAPASAPEDSFLLQAAEDLRARRDEERGSLSKSQLKKARRRLGRLYQRVRRRISSAGSRSVLGDNADLHRHSALCCINVAICRRWVVGVLTKLQPPTAAANCKTTHPPCLAAVRHCNHMVKGVSMQPSLN
jgi:hypothetical protein